MTREGLIQALTLWRKLRGTDVMVHITATTVQIPRNGNPGTRTEKPKNGQKRLVKPFHIATTTAADLHSSPGMTSEPQGASLHQIAEGIRTEIERLFARCRGANVGGRTGLWAPLQAEMHRAFR
jgi:hypothetical protein